MLAALVMVLAVLAVYFRPAVLAPGKTLLGTDYLSLHRHRIAYAQEALLGGDPHVPGWYTRELLGTPFRANIQSFPFIPTRLPLLLLPKDRAFVVGVNLAAVLAALFSYLYARRIGLGAIASAATGWTFACAGFFASRIVPGHLPLLEAYPALPFLLWLLEVCLQSGAEDPKRGPKLLALGGGTAAVALAGHPQLPAYAILAAAAYTVWRASGRPRLVLLGAMALGVGIAAFALLPTALLIERSTRVLALDAPGNDIALPWSRLLALLLPWTHGWPENVALAPARPFAGFPSSAHFWETVSFVGWLPLVALVLVAVGAAAGRPAQPAERRWLFALFAGALALALALPPAQAVFRLVPGTFLRSPARLLYLTTFALALALGVACDKLQQWAATGRRIWPRVGLGCALLAHFVELGLHDRSFVVAVTLPRDLDRRGAETIHGLVGDGRIAVDHELPLSINRAFDDVGFFDSIMLARSYRALMALDGAPPRRNIQLASGSHMRLRALRATGVRLVVTPRSRQDLRRLGGDTVGLYGVPGPAPRVRLFPSEAALFLSDEALHDRLRDERVDLETIVMLPKDAVSIAPHGPPVLGEPEALSHQRPSSDEIIVRARTGRPSFLRILESWDPGWTATVDGAPAPLLPANGAFMAIPLSPGDRQVRLRYVTPGVGSGLIVSTASLAALLALCIFGQPRRPLGVVKK